MPRGHPVSLITRVSVCLSVVSQPEIKLSSILLKRRYWERKRGRKKWSIKSWSVALGTLKAWIGQTGKKMERSAANFFSPSWMALLLSRVAAAAAASPDCWINWSPFPKQNSCHRQMISSRPGVRKKPRKFYFHVRNSLYPTSTYVTHITTCPGVSSRFFFRRHRPGLYNMLTLDTGVPLLRQWGLGGGVMSRLEIYFLRPRVQLLRPEELLLICPNRSGGRRWIRNHHTGRGKRIRGGGGGGGAPTLLWCRCWTVRTSE